MKVRYGFVSNSSSSSYMVAVKKPDKCPHCGRSDPTIVDYLLAKNDSYRTSIHKATASDFKESFSAWDDDVDMNEVAVLMEKAKEYQSDPLWDIYCVQIPYGNNPLREMFDKMLSQGNLVILSDGETY